MRYEGKEFAGSRHHYYSGHGVNADWPAHKYLIIDNEQGGKRVASFDDKILRDKCVRMLNEEVAPAAWGHPRDWIWGDDAMGGWDHVPIYPCNWESRISKPYC